jgi:sigma-B regulation protein RsbU (phosphoserine phosphatase)
MWRVIVNGGVFRDTLVNRKKNGEHYWVEQTITPMKDQSGRITHYVSVAKDVTEQRKRQEQEIRLRLARDVQQRFYPDKPISLPGIDIAGQAYPADSTGGDYFDFVPMPQNSLGIAIGDVSGHGFDSSLVMAETRAYLRAFAQTETNVGEVLNRANQALFADLEEGRYVTLSLARLEPSRRSLVYANAGHVPGYLLDSEGNCRQMLGSTGPPLGVFRQMDFPSSQIILLDPGDVLVFLTDGITDAETAGGHLFTAERALAIVKANCSRSAREIVDEVHRAVRAHMEGEPQLDDITCVVCKVVPD